MRRTALVLLSLALSGSAAAVTSTAEAAPGSGHAARVTIKYPSPPIGEVKAVSGPKAGQVTFKWKTEGLNTDYFKIETATSPFAKGPRDHQVFKVKPNLRKYTLTKKQTAKANAGIGTAWTLVWRFRAVNVEKSGKQERYFGQGQSRVMGQAPTGAGNPIRVASYNIRTDNVEQEYPGHPEWSWNNRVPRIAQQIKDVHPDIVLVQELFPTMVDKFRETLADKNMDEYSLNRFTAIKTGTDGEHKLQTRILWDNTKYESASPLCQPIDLPNDLGCTLTWPADGGPDYSPVFRLREIATGQEFYVVSVHLPNGDKLKGPLDGDDVRRLAMASILDQLEPLKADGIPIIIGGDHNSSQLRTGIRPHDLYMKAGYYDTASAVEHVNPEYGTANDFERQKPSPFGISPRIDVLMTWGMPGSDKFVNAVVPKNQEFPSDHNMIWANLRLP